VHAVGQLCDEKSKKQHNFRPKLKAEKRVKSSAFRSRKFKKTLFFTGFGRKTEKVKIFTFEKTMCFYRFSSNFEKVKNITFAKTMYFTWFSGHFEKVKTLKVLETL
jgi:hypothetical protein